MLSADWLVDQIFQATLGRRAGPDVIRAHAELIEQAQDPLRMAGDIAFNVRHSPEMIARQHLARPLQGDGYSHFITFGTHCYAATALRSAERRHASYPFDWIFSSASIVLDCVRSDFSRFLDPRYYVTSPSGEATDHSLYFDQYGVADIFAHRDPRDPTHAAYYRRCVERFRRLCRSNSRAKIIMISTRPADDQATFVHLAEWLDRHFPAATLRLLSIFPCTGDGVASIRFTEADTVGHHRWSIYHPSSNLGGLSFDNPIDDLMIRAHLVEQPVA